MYTNKVVKSENSPTMSEDPLCGLCLSRDRKLSALGSCYAVYNLIGGRYQDTSLLVCWECHANLKHIQRFQNQIFKAENLLESYYTQPLSHLSLCFKNHYDGDFIYFGVKDNKSQFNCRIISDVGVHAKSSEIAEPKTELEDGFDTWVDDSFITQQVSLTQSPHESTKSKIDLIKKKVIRHRAKERNTNLGKGAPYTEIVESHADWVKRISKILKNDRFARRQHSCLKCGLSFHTNKGLDKHLKQLHTKSPTGVPCLSCDCIAATPAVLGAHAAQHRRLRCAVCKFTTRRQHTLERHADTHLQQRVISCEICGKQFRNRQHFSLHRATHISNRSYECDQCGRVYTTRHQIFRHLRQHKKTFLCHVCGKTFSTSTYLACHSLAHEGESGRRFECAICRRRYVNKFKLEVHQRFHTGEKPYECTVCSKQFRESAQLRAHCRKLHPENAEPIRRRTFERTKSAFVNERFSESKILTKRMDDNEQNDIVKAAGKQRESREYVCSFCGKKFNDKWRLKFHLAVHSDDRPYKCSECDLTFKYQSGLWTHKLVHKGEKPHQCTICGSQFTQKGNLTAHLKIHTDEKPFQCTVCGNKFRMKRNLKNHLKVHSSLDKTIF